MLGGGSFNLFTTADERVDSPEGITTMTSTYKSAVIQDSDRTNINRSSKEPIMMCLYSGLGLLISEVYLAGCHLVVVVAVVMQRIE